MAVCIEHAGENVRVTLAALLHALGFAERHVFAAIDDEPAAVAAIPRAR